MAEVVKLVDTLASGARGGNPVEVQVLSWAPTKEKFDPMYIKVLVNTHPLFLSWPRQLRRARADFHGALFEPKNLRT